MDIVFHSWFFVALPSMARLERRLTIKLTRFSLVVSIEGTHYTRYYITNAPYYTNLVERGCTIQGDVLIEESALNEAVQKLLNTNP